MATSYAVLRKATLATEPVWEHVGTIHDTSSAKAAVRLAAEADETEGTYIAVPERSFVPVVVEFAQVARTVVKPLAAKAKSQEVAA